MTDPIVTTENATSYTFLNNELIGTLPSQAFPSNVTSDLHSGNILGIPENNVTKISNVLVLTTAMKGVIMFYNTIVIIIGVFGNIGVLYLSLKHSKYLVGFICCMLWHTYWQAHLSPRLKIIALNNLQNAMIEPKMT